MKKSRVNTPDLSTCNGKDNIKIDIIGELLINNSISESQFIDGYDLPKTLILGIISELLADRVMEIVPNTSPKEYRQSNRLPEKWEI